MSVVVVVVAVADSLIARLPTQWSVLQPQQRCIL